MIWKFYRNEDNSEELNNMILEWHNTQSEELAQKIYNLKCKKCGKTWTKHWFHISGTMGFEPDIKLKFNMTGYCNKSGPQKFQEK